VISRDIMPDFLHLTERGYRIWADAVKAPIRELMGTSQRPRVRAGNG
jgi:hypothetical protein